MTMVPFSGAERRALARWRTLQRGRVCYGLGYAITLDCVIRNLTESGAMIRVPASQPIPDTFALLHVPGGIAFEAKLSWRRGDDAGAEFIARHDLKGAVEDEFKALRAVWAALAPA
jgi:hypothetical protein